MSNSPSGVFSKSRMENFSDSIFGFGITLLLSKLIDGEPATDLLFAAKLLTVVLTAATVAVFWLAHNKIFHVIQVIDRPLLIVNTGFTMSVALMPALTQLMVNQDGQLFGVTVYAFGLCLSSLLLLATWKCAVRNGLIDRRLSAESCATIGRWMQHGIRIYGLVGLGAFVLGSVLAVWRFEKSEIVSWVIYVAALCGLFARQVLYVTRRGEIDRFAATQTSRRIAQGEDEQAGV